MDDYTRRAMKTPRKFLKNLDKKAGKQSFVAKLATLLKPFEEHWVRAKKCLELFIGISAGLFLIGSNFGLLWLAWLWGIPTFLSQVFLYLTFFLPCFRDDDIPKSDDKWHFWVTTAAWLVIFTWFFGPW